MRETKNIMTNRIQLYKIKRADGTYLQNSLFDKDWQGALGESLKQARYLLGSTTEPGDIRVERPLKEVLNDYRVVCERIGGCNVALCRTFPGILKENLVKLAQDAKDLEQEILLGYRIEAAPVEEVKAS